ncbi:divalent-cation tolerance protein CutA [Sphingomonas crocodyli]|uniref:Divalent-cation tolerance protein CutA n=1 Tax=Sphingomonas crocodyli TaxID=1979270 RepID=A0A437LVE8_9SPHN|nr:divalent-cation tolerance protein CutA [Sphingomonas crocodyli]RVT89344.1 divalent-cation tolerance protein CutA [Sphingomonas crocodyli]
MTQAVIIFTSCGSAGEAERIAEALVAERLAACVQMQPVTSIYRWHGAVERAAEVLLHIKTRSGLAPAVEARIRALHSYEVPEVVVVPVSTGSADYLGWIRDETD